MKRTKILIILCSLVLSIMAVNVRAINDDHKDVVNNEIDTGIQPAPGGVLFPTVPDGVRLFTICNKVGRNCITVDTNTINNNQKYDLFEIKDNEIYLNNSEIALKIINKFPDNKEYIVHISGTNKISMLDNTILYLDDSSFIPFKVVGDGTLEIELLQQPKKNAVGEIYYKCWDYHSNNCYVIGDIDIGNISNIKTAKSKDIRLISNSDSWLTDQESIYSGKCLSEALVDESNVKIYVPDSGYTVTDLKAKFGADINSIYVAPSEMINTVLTIEEYNLSLTTEDSLRLLKNYKSSDYFLTQDNRVNFIDSIVNAGKRSLDISCGVPYLIPKYMVYDMTQITDSWGKQYIKTDLPRSFSKTGSYLINFKEEKPMIKSTRTNNIVFESTEEFDPNYHLVVDDITEKITDVQSANVQAKTDKVLVELYDIYMADENDNIVKMENGTYKIKVELNDLLKKYEGYEIIYISEENKVELIDARIEDNYITFNTTHLSKYGVVGKEIKKTGNIITNPQTADSVVTYGLMLVSLAVAIALVVLRIRKLKNN